MKLAWIAPLVFACACAPKPSPTTFQPNESVRKQFESVTASDVTMVELSGPYLNAPDKEDPKAVGDPQEIRDKAKIGAMIEAFKKAEKRKLTTGHAGIPENILFHMDHATGKPDIFISVTGASVLDDFGPEVEKMYLTYLQRPLDSYPPKDLKKN